MSIQVSAATPTSPAKGAGDRATYLTQLLNQRPEWDGALNAGAIAWLQEIRQQAVTQVQAATIPTTRNEEWRFTDLSDWVKVAFAPAQSGVIPPEQIASLTLPEAANSRLVFVNGMYAPEFSATAELPEGLLVGNLAGLAATQADLQTRLQAYLAQQTGGDEVFTALNTASFTDAAVIYAPKNFVAEPLIHLLLISVPGEQPTVAYPRVLVVAEANSAITLVEDYVTLGEGTAFTNAVTEIWLAENAQVKHTRIQRENQAALHIGKTAVSQARDARYHGHAINLGAKLSRHNPEIFQRGEQTETVLNGLSWVDGDRHTDTHSTIAYSKPHGSSRQLQKCIVADKAHAVFNGKVFVPKAAQLTDAGQLNQNLLLSPKARVDTKPQLEIVADNVKCTHGATVGQLDADEVFYLQSRGIDADSARKLLVYAFAYEVLKQVPSNSLRDTLSRMISAHT